MQRRKGIVIAPLLLAGLVMLGQYFHSEKVVNPETGRAARVAMSAQQEEALGFQSYQEVLSQSRVVETGPEHDMVLRVAQRLAPATGEAAKNFKWEVSVVESSQVNAFCLPGGKIVVYTGILPYTQNEAGLAAVMGHEMAHARRGPARLATIAANQSRTDLHDGGGRERFIERHGLRTSPHGHGCPRRRHDLWSDFAFQPRT